MEAIRGELSKAEICRKYGITNSFFYKTKNKKNLTSNHKTVSNEKFKLF
jgi:hypothetical protein